MTKNTKRYEPCTREDIEAWMAEQHTPKQFMNAGYPYHLITLCLHNKPLLDAYAVVGRYISSDLSISPRDREVLIVRCAVKMQSIYEWGHHVKIAKSVGLTDQDLEQLRLATPDAMSANDMVLIHACDELLAKSEISAETFRLLSEKINTSCIMEIVSVVGLYSWTAMLVKSFHVSLEDALLHEKPG